MDATKERRTFAWRRWLALAAALYLLNLALSFHNVWPTPWVEARHELSVEIALLILGLALWAEFFGVPGRRFTGLLAVLLTLLVIGRYGDVTAPALYGRTVNLYWDARHLPKVVAMLVEVAPAWLVAAAILGLTLLLALVFWLLWWALLQVRSGLADPPVRRGMGGTAALLTVLYFAGHASESVKTEQWFSRPVTRTYVIQAAFVADALANSGAARKLPTSPPVASDLGRVTGAHVVILFLESYGATVYDRRDVAAGVESARADLEAAIVETGRGAVSAFVRSPTFAGGSWLAHVSLLSGIEVTDSGTYKLLLTQDRDTLVHRFRREGYRVVAVMPGLRMAWPEGAFYRFDSILGEAEIDYRGPEFGWWRIPDQYALARLDDLELDGGDGQPRFVFFPTVSTHLPFRPTPPYEPDWGRMLTAEPYEKAAYDSAMDQKPEWFDLGSAYADSVAYAFTYLAGYLRLREATDLVLVVLGDHQPAASVSGEGASWDVPVHVITARTDILNALRSEGFVSGVTPHRPRLAATHELYGILLRALDSKTSAAAASGESGVDVPGAVGGAETGEKPADLVGVDPAGRCQAVGLAGGPVEAVIADLGKAVHAFDSDFPRGRQVFEGDCLQGH